MSDVAAAAAQIIADHNQLLISNRARQRAPNLTTLDRFVLGLTTLFVNPRRIAKLGAIEAFRHDRIEEVKKGVRADSPH